MLQQPALLRSDAAQSGVLDSVRQRITALGLDLSGLTVITEAATGHYATTAVIAALAGAKRVIARTRDTARHGSAREAAAATLSLAGEALVADRITIVKRIEDTHLAACDILTNTGNLRPITRAVIEHLPARAVVALMYEAWELRGDDIDLAACRERGIRVAAVNERHPDVGVFPFLGPLCVRLLADAGVNAAGRRVALICDNPFAPFIEAGLGNAGATVQVFQSLADLRMEACDVVAVAVNPEQRPALGFGDFEALAAHAPSALVAQFWGDIDRGAARRAGFGVCPDVEPARGHMGILLNALGHEPIVRLQAGGLAAAAAIYHGHVPFPGDVSELLA